MTDQWCLVLEIEFLTRVSFAAIGRDVSAPEWPPQPDRVFSALVSSWANGGESDRGREALEWLESLDPPTVYASEAYSRPGFLSYVPANDKLKATTKAFWRTSNERTFPAAIPHDPSVLMVWATNQSTHVNELSKIATDVAYVGHSASLTRCRFTMRAERPTGGQSPRRRVYPGRLSELRSAFAQGKRPIKGDIFVTTRQKERAVHTNSSSDWMVFELVEGDVNVRSICLVTKVIRNALMSGYGKARLTVPEWISGHRENGEATDKPHLFIVPMTNVGFRHSDGKVFGFALVPPKNRQNALKETDFLRALGGVMKTRKGRYIIDLFFDNYKLSLAHVQDHQLSSLLPDRYVAGGRTWCSVTPIILPRHLKSNSHDEINRQLESACSHSGLARPVKVNFSEHSALEGAESCHRGGWGPSWTQWKTPPVLQSRPILHAVIEFEERVCGPVLIGAGRFHGMGLCLPLDEKEA